MNSSASRPLRTPGARVVSLLAAAATLALDLSGLSGTAIGAGYALPVLLWPSSGRRSVPLRLAACGTFLILLAGFLGPGGAGLAERITNRIVALGVVWGLAVGRTGLREGSRTTDRRGLPGASAERVVDDLQQVLSTMRSSLVRLDGEGRILNWNGIARDTFGSSLEEIRGRRLDDCGVDWGEASLERLRLLIEDPEGEGRCECTFLDGRGDCRGMAFTGSTVMDSTGRRNVLLVGQDITDQLTSLEEQRRLVTAIEQVDETILITDVDGRIVYTNPAFERITGYSREEVLGENPRLLKSGAQGPAFYEALWRTLLAGKAFSGHFTNRRKDGSFYEEEATISPVLGESGWITHFVAVKRDITERLQREVQLRSAQKLESMGQLAAGIAHEINTPTQYINDNTSFLQESFKKLGPLLEFCAALGKPGADAPPPETQLAQVIALAEQAGVDFLAQEIPEALDESLSGLRRVAEIVGAMRDFAHPGTAQKQSVQLNETIERAVLLSRNEWKYVADLELQLDPDLPPVPCLAGEMGQVIINMLVNAAHAITDVVGSNPSQRGRIAVSTGIVDGEVEIRVSDTGCGMSEEVRSHVFDPFFTTKEVGKGTGQGLAIAHSVVVEKHGGSITVESEHQRGSTFRVRIPLAPTPTEKAPCAA